jgi:hypothetical protein
MSLKDLKTYLDQLESITYLICVEHIINDDENKTSIISKMATVGPMFGQLCNFLIPHENYNTKEDEAHSNVELDEKINRLESYLADLCFKIPEKEKNQQVFGTWDENVFKILIGLGRSCVLLENTSFDNVENENLSLLDHCKHIYDTLIPVEIEKTKILIDRFRDIDYNQNQNVENMQNEMTTDEIVKEENLITLENNEEKAAA